MKHVSCMHTPFRTLCLLELSGCWEQMSSPYICKQGIVKVDARFGLPLQCTLRQGKVTSATCSRGQSKQVIPSASK